jgi:hypothetical protein
VQQGNEGMAPKVGSIVEHNYIFFPGLSGGNFLSLIVTLDERSLDIYGNVNHDKFAMYKEILSDREKFYDWRQVQPKTEKEHWNWSGTPMCWHRDQSYGMMEHFDTIKNSKNGTAIIITNTENTVEWTQRRRDHWRTVRNPKVDDHSSEEFYVYQTWHRFLPVLNIQEFRMLFVDQLFSFKDFSGWITTNLNFLELSHDQVEALHSIWRKNYDRS